MKIINILAVMFIITNLVDLITALFILPGESNPIYIKFGLGAVLVPKLLMCVIAWFLAIRKLHSKSHTIRYLVSYFIVMGIVLTSVGIMTNVSGIGDEEQLQKDALIPDNVKITYYFSIVSILYIIPFIFSFIAFLVYENWMKKDGFYDT